MMHQSITSLFVLVLIIPVIFASLYLFKRMTTGRFTGNQQIKIMNQISLGSKERLLLLQMNETTILIGVTPHRISTLHVCTEEASERTETSLS